METDQKGLNILHYICINGYIKLLKLVLSHLKSHESNDSKNFTLLSKYINMHCRSTKILTPLQYCCIYFDY